jgi:multicomponent Na+:H+ antiporter subunit C
VQPDTANPLPQALSLTAIVISFGLTLYLLALARRQQILTGDDLVEDDVEDRRIAAFADQRAARTDETRELEALHEDDTGADPLHVTRSEPTVEP